MFGSRNWRVRLGVALAGVFVLTTGGAEAITWEAEYAADDTPARVSPKWLASSKAQGTTEEISGGQLVVRADPGASRYYTMGFLNSARPAGDAAWNGNSGTSTVEFRVACQAEKPEKAIFQVSVTDGSLRWDIDFLSSSIVAGGKKFEGDTSKAETYRVVLDGGKMRMTTSDGTVIFNDLKGSILQDDRNRIVFGTDARDGDASQGGGSWSLDFLRWTNKEAASE